MESFTTHIQHQLHDILGDLEPRVNVALTQENLERLFAELEIRDEGVKERSTEQLTDILQQYRHTLKSSYEQTKQIQTRSTTRVSFASIKRERTVCYAKSTG